MKKHLIALLTFSYCITALVIYLYFVTSNIYKVPRAVLPFGTAEALNYTSVVKQGETLHTLRRILGEPKGCTVHIKRYLSPINNTRLELLIYDIIRITEGQEDAQIDFLTPIPSSTAPGEYMFYAKVEYYCSYLQNLLGPATLTNQPILIKIVPK
jgi:lipopolysaccharide biosynthesis regulator YciM